MSGVGFLDLLDIYHHSLFFVRIIGTAFTTSLGLVRNEQIDQLESIYTRSMQ